MACNYDDDDDDDTYKILSQTFVPQSTVTAASVAAKKKNIDKLIRYLDDKNLYKLPKNKFNKSANILGTASLTGPLALETWFRYSKGEEEEEEEEMNHRIVDADPHRCDSIDRALHVSFIFDVDLCVYFKNTSKDRIPDPVQTEFLNFMKRPDQQHHKPRYERIIDDIMFETDTIVKRKKLASRCPTKCTKMPRDNRVSAFVSFRVFYKDMVYRTAKEVHDDIADTPLEDTVYESGRDRDANFVWFLYNGNKYGLVDFRKCINVRPVRATRQEEQYFKVLKKKETRMHVD